MLTFVSSSSSDDDDEEESESDESDEDEESELEDELSFPSAFRFAFSFRANSSFSFCRSSFFISFVRDCLKNRIATRINGPNVQLWFTSVDIFVCWCIHMTSAQVQDTSDISHYSRIYESVERNSKTMFEGVHVLIHKDIVKILVRNRIKITVQTSNILNYRHVTWFRNIPKWIKISISRLDYHGLIQIIPYLTPFVVLIKHRSTLADALQPFRQSLEYL